MERRPEPLSAAEFDVSMVSESSNAFCELYEYPTTSLQTNADKTADLPTCASDISISLDLKTGKTRPTQVRVRNESSSALYASYHPQCLQRRK